MSSIIVLKRLSKHLFLSILAGFILVRTRPMAVAELSPGLVYGCAWTKQVSNSAVKLLFSRLSERCDWLSSMLASSATDTPLLWTKDYLAEKYVDDMKNIQKLAYISEINIQCTYALNALSNAVEAIQQSQDLSPDETRPYYNEVFRNIHSFLTHAGNMSKLFWPIRTKNAVAVVRGEVLCQEFGLTDSSALNKRTLRDNLEHYDERLDVINQEYSTGFYPDAVMTMEQLKQRGILPELVMRLFDYESMTFFFRGIAFDLNELATSVKSIHLKSHSLLSQNWTDDNGSSLTASYTKEQGNDDSHLRTGIE